MVHWLRHETRKTAWQRRQHAEQRRALVLLVAYDNPWIPGCEAKPLLAEIREALAFDLPKPKLNLLGRIRARFVP